MKDQRKRLTIGGEERVKPMAIQSRSIPKNRVGKNLFKREEIEKPDLNIVIDSPHFVLGYYKQYRINPYTFYTRENIFDAIKFDNNLTLPAFLEIYRKNKIEEFHVTIERSSKEENEEIEVMYRFIRSSSYLRKIGIYDTTLSGEMGKKLFHAIQGNLTISVMWCLDVSLPKDILNFISPFLLFKNITEFNLERVLTGQNNIHSLVRKVHYCPSITNLTLSNIFIDKKEVYYILEMVQYTSTLTTLDLSVNSFSIQEARNIFSGLASNSSVAKLNFSSNFIRDEGIGYVAKCLKTNTTLTSLDISSNHATDRCIPYLLGSLRSNTSLINLNLKNNKVSDAGVQKILGVLPGLNPNLTIDLRNNDVKSYREISKRLARQSEHTEGKMATILVH